MGNQPFIHTRVPHWTIEINSDHFTCFVEIFCECLPVALRRLVGACIGNAWFQHWCFSPCLVAGISHHPTYKKSKTNQKA